MSRKKPQPLVNVKRTKFKKQNLKKSEVLGRFLFYHKNDKLPINLCAQSTANEINSTFKHLTNLKNVYNISRDIKKLYWKYKKINKYKATIKQQNAAENFMLDIQSSFVLTTETTRKKISKSIKLRRFSESHEDEDNISISSGDEFVVPKSNVNNTNKIISKSSILSKELSSALDRSKVSTRNAVHILATTVQSLGKDLNNIVLNRESIRQARMQCRTELNDEIKETFSTNYPLVIHWDGKKLSDLRSRAKVERLAVYVSGGKDTVKLLGAPCIANGKGNTQAEAVYNLITDWKLKDQIEFMCFDTTASNTGHQKGACYLLETQMQKELIALACRHHVLELLVGKCFEVTIEPIVHGPNITLFQKFEHHWPLIDKTNFKTGLTDSIIAANLNDDKNSLIEFYSRQLEFNQPRDDYCELLQLVLVFLDKSPMQIKFRPPGAYHRARWMAKIIYAYKIFLFRHQFLLTKKEESGLIEFLTFTTKIYLKNWYTAENPISAPYNDLILLKELFSYQNKLISQNLSNVFLRHLWYLNEYLAPIALFDKNVSITEKMKMVYNIKNIKGAKTVSKRIVILPKDINTKEISDFITQNSLKIFNTLKLNTSFLENHPSKWPKLKEYIINKNIISNLKIVNDVAERGVAMAQSYNKTMTTNEEQQQNILQIVEKHRKDFPDCKKSRFL